MFICTQEVQVSDLTDDIDVAMFCVKGCHYRDLLCENDDAILLFRS